MPNVSLSEARALLGTINNPADRAKLGHQIQIAIDKKATGVEVSWVRPASNGERIRDAAQPGDTFMPAEVPTVGLSDDWLKSAATVKKAESADLTQKMAEAQGLLGTSGLGALERARLNLYIAGAGIELAGRNISKKDNAVASLTALISAVKSAPNDPPVVIAYAQAMYTMANLPWYLGPIANLWLKKTFKTGIEFREGEALSLLKALVPPTPQSAVGIRILATHLDDPKSLDLAAKQLTGVPEETIKRYEAEYAALVNRTKDVKVK